MLLSSARLSTALRFVGVIRMRGGADLERLRHLFVRGMVICELCSGVEASVT